MPLAQLLALRVTDRLQWHCPSQCTLQWHDNAMPVVTVKVIHCASASCVTPAATSSRVTWTHSGSESHGDGQIQPEIQIAMPLAVPVQCGTGTGTSTGTHGVVTADEQKIGSRCTQLCLKPRQLRRAHGLMHGVGPNPVAQCGIEQQNCDPRENQGASSTATK